MKTTEPVPGSFRDPSGFLYRQDGVLLRQVNEAGREGYDLLMESGLYEALVSGGLLIPHVEETVTESAAGVYKILRPELVDFISYPYEWSFSQLKDAALATLEIQRQALEHGMILKDASAFNLQFHRGRPTFIDTLSFEAYVEGEPWVAYRQFCQHFLAPLALLSYTDHRLGRLLRVFLDGVPLDLASRLLPARSRLKLSLLTHLHLHAKVEERASDKTAKHSREARVSRRGLDGILASLESGVRSLSWKPSGTEWADYYSDTNYSTDAWTDKQQQIERLLGDEPLDMVWDLGANTGEFSRVAAGATSETGLVVAFDIDPAAVEKNYLRCREEGESRILPLVLDLTNPSPGLGWEGAERAPFAERGRPDAVIALALIHHLAIGNNLPLERIASFLRSLSDRVILEFVPKDDSQVQRMLATRKDIFPNYTREGFEAAVTPWFEIRESVPVSDSERRLYLLDGTDRPRA